VKKLVLAEESYHAKERVTRAVRFALQVAFSRDEAATCLENLTHHLYLGTWHKAFGAGETVPGSKLDAENCDRRRRSVWLAVGLGPLPEQHQGTVVSKRATEPNLRRRVNSHQVQFHESLQNERDLGNNFREKES